MAEEMERDLGEQPIAALLVKHDLKPSDLVAASTEQLTHKMVSRAIKGRRLTPNVQGKVLRALNTAADQAYPLTALFTYA
jgi:hypothetical protein